MARAIYAPSLALAVAAVVVACIWPWNLLAGEPFAEGLNNFLMWAVIMWGVPVEYVQQRACEGLSDVPSNPRAQSYLAVYLHGAELMTRALRNYPDNKQIQRYCREGLAASSVFNAETSLRNGNAGAVELALKAFSRWKDDPSFVMVGDLNSFCSVCIENHARFTDNNGIELVHEIAKLHPDDMWVQFNAYRAFSVGCGSAASARRCVYVGIVPTMVATMRKHREFWVREEIMHVTRAIAQVDEHLSHLVDAGVVPELVATMRERSDSISTQSVGCGALGSLVATQPYELDERLYRSAANVSEMQQLLGKSGAIEVITQAFEIASWINPDPTVPSLYSVERECPMAIFVLSCHHAGNQAAFVRLDAPALIAQHMRAKAEEDEVQSHGCLALMALSEDGAENKAAVDAVKPPNCKAWEEKLAEEFPSLVA